MSKIGNVDVEREGWLTVESRALAIDCGQLRFPYGEFELALMKRVNGEGYNVWLTDPFDGLYELGESRNEVETRKKYSEIVSGIFDRRLALVLDGESFTVNPLRGKR